MSFAYRQARFICGKLSGIKSSEEIKMAICEIHLGNNNALGKMTSFMAILPEGQGKGPFPVFYLLHGLSDNHTAWARRTSVERYVDGLPLIVVMPNSERGWYSDAQDLRNQNFETLIVRDIVGFVDNNFQTIASREGRVIAGLSMGGYGAMKLALKHPDMFCAAVSHSGAVEFASRSFVQAGDGERGEDWLREFVPIFGENPQGSDNDVFALAERGESSTRPALRIDCGTEDFLIESNRHFHAHLQKLGIEHEYAEHPGEHNWEYWDEHIKETIAFFKRELKLNKEPEA
jgi:S-formylglutathione hydrolase FrmB